MVFTSVLSTLALSEPPPVFSQDILSLYGRYLTSPLMGNENYRKMASYIIGTKAGLHPHLIYYAIRELNARFNDTSRSELRSMRYRLYTEEVKYEAARNDWLTRQRNALDLHEENYGFRKRGEQYLVPSNIDSAGPDSAGAVIVDDNLMNFFSVIYLTGDEASRYDSTRDYGALWEKEEDSLLDRYERLHAVTGPQGGRSDGNSIDDVVSHWYIFNDREQAWVGRSGFADACEIIDKIVKEEYSARAIPRFGLSIGYSGANAVKSLGYSYPVDYTKYSSYALQANSYPDQTVQIRHNMAQMVVSLDYRHVIEDNLAALSYVDLGANLSFSLGRARVDNSYGGTSTSVGAQSITVSETTTGTDTVAIRSLNMYTAKVGVPFFLIGRSMFFEVCANMGIVSVSSTVDYHFRMTRTEGYPVAASPWYGGYYSHRIATGFANGSMNLSKAYFVIFPTVEIRWEPFRNIQVQSTVGVGYIAMGTGIAL